jgi:dethiobiotin synthetase
VHGCFVTGTDTGVGKSVLSAALVAALAAAGQPVRAHKPVLSGTEEPPGPWPPDHELLGLAAGMDPDAVAPLRYGPPVSPHLAAQLAGAEIDVAAMVAGVRRAFGGGPGPLVVEGVGGLFVPLAGPFTVCDLAREVGLPVVIAARPGLGTINHSLLTVRAARAAGLDVRAVVLTPWPTRPSVMEQSNRDTIAALGEVEVAGLGFVAEPRRELLAQAGAGLPYAGWLGCAA